MVQPNRLAAGAAVEPGAVEATTAGVDEGEALDRDELPEVLRPAEVREGLDELPLRVSPSVGTPVPAPATSCCTGGAVVVGAGGCVVVVVVGGRVGRGWVVVV